MSENTNTERAGRFTKKPVTIDAWLIDFGNKPLPEWVNEAFRTEVIDWCPAGEGLFINTLEGHMLGANGSWLIKGVQGELYACKPDIFEATYTRASLSLPAAGQEPYCWTVTGGHSMFRGQYAKQDALSEAKHCGGTAIALPLYTAPQPTQAQAGAVPMSHKDAKALALKYGIDPLHLVLQVERHHGITGGQHGTE